MRTIKHSLFCLVLLPFALHAQEERASGQQSEPLDPPSMRTTTLQLGQGRDQVTSGTAFNPAISVIMDGAYYSDNVHGEAFELLEDLDGFAGGHHDHNGDGHGHGLDRGFNLREVEIAMSATVDPYFDAFMMMVFEDGDFDLEEAYVTTRALPHGLQMKFGRFLSDIGYINRQHPHQWLFTDRPLMNELLFGDHGLQEDGLQVSWMPPTPMYTRFGIELLQGDNEHLSNQVGHVEPVGGTERILDDKAGPRLFTGFARIAPDLGYDHALQIGLFGGYSSSYQDTDEHSTRFEDHQGTARFWGTDWVYKYDPGGAYGQGTLVLQGEYAYRRRNIDRMDVYFTCHPVGVACDDPANEFQPGDTRNIQSFNDKHDGFYLQGVYGFLPRWNAGLRYEKVGMTNFLGRGAGTDFDSSDRWTAQVTFIPTEFSRLRLQFSRSDFAVDGERERFNQLFLQWQVSLGVHGAHEF